MTRGLGRLALEVMCLALLACSPVLAGGFAVSPLRLELGPAVRSGVIEVRNTGSEKLSFQLEALEWAQDEAGKDKYSETRDLVFFPKIMSLNAGEEAIVRIGLRAALAPTEKTYRFFIEELPGVGRQPQGPSAQVTFLVRFGVPIFAAPISPQDGLAVEGFGLNKGTVELAAKNTGNRHQVVSGVQLRGTDTSGATVYSLDIADRYLLSGTKKSYTTTIAADQCHKIDVLAVEIKTDRLSETRKLNVNRSMCP